MPVSTAEIQKMVGAYRNGDQRIEVVTRDSRLYVKLASREFELVRHGENHFSGGSEFTVVRGADGTIRYLHAGLRAFARVP